MNMQAPLNFPEACRDWRHDGNAKIALQSRHDTEHIQARSQHIDGVRALVLKKLLLDEGIYEFRGHVPDRIEGDLDSFHGDHADAAILEIFRIGPVEIGAERGDPENFLDL